MKNGFCIIMTKYRLYQGIALYYSLNTIMKNLEIFILCIDEETYEILSKLNLINTTLVSIEEIENEVLLKKKIERPLNAYCWTLKPVFLEYVINKFKNINRITYIDSDMYFFNDPNPIFEEGAKYSVLLSPHNYTRSLKHLESICGKYNSGFISFKKDIEGLNALKWWKERCIEWCYDKVEEGKFGDQKYLDNIQSIFNNTYDIKTPGVNIGFWNHGRYKTTIINGKVYINNVQLICYHFAGLRLLSKKEVAFIIGFKKEFIRDIYNPYINTLQNVISKVKAISNFNGYFIDKKQVQGAIIHRVNV
ncbi:hypothetical protein FQB35_06760 [Crassaminicella thermophila]|uniref:Nucleotide-diphospho-sugar transferase n=1 Tax=Crassaminicella thermophila TaxID=2599308 RepID=A0A5C0SGL6_CRATE|nr:hypothetical protein [Crassaminicella thermophila]QEK12099.1 hypothetical protein FQB35_06760 [Crassaminicella thermophila]